MAQDRRTFLKTTALAGAAAAGVTALASPALAQAQNEVQGQTPVQAPQPGGASTMPKGFTFATLNVRDGLRPRRQDRARHVDVAAAEQDYREGAPTTIDAVFKGEGDASTASRRLVDKASAGTERYFVAIDKAEFGPCVTNPEKIVCVGLNYREHAAETGNPVPNLRSCSTSSTPR